MVDVSNFDLYQLLGITDETCTRQALVKGFRRQALRCHPDKFPDDATANERFLRLSKAFEILSDKKARDAYDSCRLQKKIQEQKYQQMDDRRKKFKQTLEENEKQAQQKTQQTTTTSSTQQTANEKFKSEIERLRREGSQLLSDELEKLHLFNQKQMNSDDYLNFDGCRIIIKWNTNDLSKQLYNEKELENVFSKYGCIQHIVFKNSSAILEFENEHVSHIIEQEKGLDDHVQFISIRIIQTQKQTTKLRTRTETRKKEVKQNFEDYEATILKRLASFQNNQATTTA